MSRQLCIRCKKRNANEVICSACTAYDKKLENNKSPYRDLKTTRGITGVTKA